ESEAFGVKGIVGQPGELLLLHGPAPAAVDASDFDLQVDAGVATGQVADPAPLAVVEGATGLAAGSAGRFFRWRRKDTMRALGSPKMPRTRGSGRKPGNRYASARRRGFRMQRSCQVFAPPERRKTPGKWPRSPSTLAAPHPLTLEKSPFSFNFL